MWYLVNIHTRTKKKVLPRDLVDVPLLVILLDQGSIGAAGTGYSDYLFKMVLMKFEKIHRLMRDIKLALQHMWRRTHEGSGLQFEFVELPPEAFWIRSLWHGTAACAQCFRDASHC